MRTMLPDQSTVEQESQLHDYEGNRIPWYVRLIWVLFWIFVVYYTIVYMIPAIQIELFTRP